VGQMFQPKLVLCLLFPCFNYSHCFNPSSCWDLVAWNWGNICRMGIWGSKHQLSMSDKTFALIIYSLLHADIYIHLCKLTVQSYAVKYTHVHTSIPTCYNSVQEACENKAPIIIWYRISTQKQPNCEKVVWP